MKAIFTRLTAAALLGASALALTGAPSLAEDIKLTVVGVGVTDSAARNRDSGIVDHASHGRSVRIGGWLGRNGRWASTALLALAVWVLLRAIHWVASFA